MTDKILIFRTDRIGDLIFTCPAIISIKKHFKECEITLIASNKNYVYALFKSIGPLTRSILKSIFYLIFFKKTEFVKYFFRSYGLISSIIGMRSWYRID